MPKRDLVKVIDNYMKVIRKAKELSKKKEEEEIEKKKSR